MCFVVWEWSAWCVNGLGCVILEEWLQEHAHCAEHTHKHKDPQEEPIDHHGNVFPVLAHLCMGEGGTKGVWDKVKRKIKVSRITLSPHPLILALSVPPPSAMQRVNGGEGLM